MPKKQDFFGIFTEFLFEICDGCFHRQQCGALSSDARPFWFNWSVNSIVNNEINVMFFF